MQDAGPESTPTAVGVTQRADERAEPSNEVETESARDDATDTGDTADTADTAGVRPDEASVSRLIAQLSTSAQTPGVVGGRMPSNGGKKRGDPRISLLQTQCLKLSLSILSRPNRHARSLGFTSAIAGEGKSFLATLTATALTGRAHKPVTLVDCNWDDPSLHTLYDLPATPGLAEWLRHECDLEQIRHEVAPSLTVIPAGEALNDAVALTEALKAAGALTLVTQADEALIVDMPSVLTTPYGSLLAQQLDAVLLVVRAGVTWDSYVQEACNELSAASVEGVVLNATRSFIPRWLQRLL